MRRPIACILLCVSWLAVESPAPVVLAQSPSAPGAQMKQLPMNELVALARHIEKCWNRGSRLPKNFKPVVIEMRVQLNLDGTLVERPAVLDKRSDAAFIATAKSAVDAVVGCQPYRMLSPAYYHSWKDMIFRFAPPGAS